MFSQEIILSRGGGGVKEAVTYNLHCENLKIPETPSKYFISQSNLGEALPLTDSLRSTSVKSLIRPYHWQQMMHFTISVSWVPEVFSRHDFVTRDVTSRPASDVDRGRISRPK